MTWSLRHDLALGDLMLNNQASTAQGSYRAFTEVTALSTLSGYIASLPAAATFQTATLEQRGAALAQSASGGAALGANLQNTFTAVGAGAAQATGVTGQFAAAIGLATIPGAAGLTALRDFGATLRGLAGV